MQPNEIQEKSQYRQLHSVEKLLHYAKNASKRT